MIPCSIEFNCREHRQETSADITPFEASNLARRPLHYEGDGLLKDKILVEITKTFLFDDFANKFKSIQKLKFCFRGVPIEVPECPYTPFQKFNAPSAFLHRRNFGLL
jgi:hypothetical protein